MERIELNLLQPLPQLEMFLVGELIPRTLAVLGQLGLVTTECGLAL